MKAKYDDNDMGKLARFLVSELEDRFRLHFEAIDAIKLQTDKIPRMEADIHQLKQDVATLKLVMKATNKDVHNHERRITKLEGRAYA